MNKKISTSIAISIIAVFALLVGVIIFLSSYFQNNASLVNEVAPFPQNNNSSIKGGENNSEGNASTVKKESNQVPKRFSGSGCYEKEKEGYDNFYLLSKDFNLDDANSKAKYENIEKGISFDIPYNAKWGNKNCKVEPYTEFIQPSGGVLVEFGKPQAWIPSEFRLIISSQRSSDDIINELNGFMEEPKVQPIKKIIANNQVVFWKSSEVYPSLSYEVVGKQYNYRFDCNGSDSQSEAKKLEQIISSVKLF